MKFALASVISVAACLCAGISAEASDPQDPVPVPVTVGCDTELSAAGDAAAAGVNCAFTKYCSPYCKKHSWNDEEGVVWQTCDCGVPFFEPLCCDLHVGNGSIMKGVGACSKQYAQCDAGSACYIFDSVPPGTFSAECL